MVKTEMKKQMTVYYVLCTRILTILFFIFCTLFSGKFAIAQGQSARMYISSGASTTFKVGDTVNFVVYIDTAGSAMDSADGKVMFSTAFFDHVATSTSGTEFKLWTIYPEESGGAVLFGGGKPNPGFNGSMVKVFTLILRAKQAGTGNISLSGRLLANGTVANSDTDSLNITINPAPVTSGTTGSSGSASPSNNPTSSSSNSVQISSTSHPSGNQFYPDNDPKFTFLLPQSTQGISYTYDKNASTIPASKSMGLKTTLELVDLEPGTWYVHAKALSASGWGTTTHFKFNISEPTLVTSTPLPAPQEINTSFNPQIEYYQVTATQPLFIEFDSAKTTTYSSVPIEPGHSYVKVVATDVNGNKIERTLVSDDPSVKAPELQVPEVVSNAQQSRITGTTHYPKTEVVISLQKDEAFPVRYLVYSNESGEFEYVIQNDLGEGKYSIWAEVLYDNKIKSYASSRKTFELKQGSTIQENQSNKAYTYLLFILPLMVIPFVAITIAKKRHVSKLVIK